MGWDTQYKMHGVILFYPHKHGIAIKEPLTAAYGYVVFKLLFHFSASWGGGGCFLRNCGVDALFVEAVGGSHRGAPEGAACCPNVLIPCSEMGCQAATGPACLCIEGSLPACLPVAFAAISTQGQGKAAGLC